MESFIIVMNRSIDNISENKIYPTELQDLMDPYTGNEDAEAVVIGGEEEDEEPEEEQEIQEGDQIIVAEDEQ